MEYILKCGKKTFTGNSISEVEADYLAWANEQDDFVADSYTVIGLCGSPYSNTRTEVVKSSRELLNKYNYIYITIAELDSVDNDYLKGTYEASYHLTKETAVIAARKIIERHNNIISTRVVAHRIGGIDNNNTWDDNFDLLLANFNRTNSSYSWED